MPFNAYNYQLDAMIKQLLKIELHAKDGSAVSGGCSCIQDKHLVLLEGLAEETKVFTKKEKEKRFYDWVASLARDIRVQIDGGTFDVPAQCSHKCPPCNCK